MKPPPASGEWAYFLDLDGTLLDIAETPDRVQVTPLVQSALRHILAATNGALALISGRSLSQIDALLAPLVLPAAGEHGFERRDAAGRLHRGETDTQALAEIARDLEAFSTQNADLLLERKGASLALHYRARPDAHARVLTKMRELERRHAGTVELQTGKAVVELKPRGANKGGAIAAFLSEAPFAGRPPFFAGDDVTDEDGFRLVNARGGLSMRIGDPSLNDSSAARCRLSSPADFLDWVAALPGL